MFIGNYLIKISVEFFFTNILKLLYNKIDKIKVGKKKDGKLQYDEKS